MLLLIKNIFFVPITLLRLFRFLFIIFINRNKTIYLIDIDNTIADSWHSLMLKNVWYNEKERVKDLAVFIGMRNVVLHAAKQSNSKIIFFTARSIFSVKATFNWLQASGFAKHSTQLVVTRTAHTKMIFLKSIFFSTKKIVYIDDLSHKHETGTPVFFTKTLDAVKALQNKRSNFIYVDAALINKINTEYAKSPEEVTNYFFLY